MDMDSITVTVTVQIKRDPLAAMSAAVEAQRQSNRRLALVWPHETVAVCTYDSEGLAA